jgi:hypothetical protein
MYFAFPGLEHKPLLPSGFVFWPSRKTQVTDTPAIFSGTLDLRHVEEHHEPTFYDSDN